MTASPFGLLQADRLAPLDGAKCVVLGGGGFIGQHLCHALSAAGANVRAFDHHPPSVYIPRDVRWIQGSIEDEVALLQALENQQIVFHLAGASVPGSSNRDFSADLRSSVLPTLKILEACARLNIERIVFTSSGGTVYGPQAASPIAETSQTDPISAYGISKLAIEKYLALSERLHKVKGLVARISNPYGPLQNTRRNQGFVAAVLERFLAGEPVEIWGSGEVVRDYIYISDVVCALVSIAGYGGVGRVFNVGSGIGLSLDSVSEAASALLGLETRVIRKDPRPGDVQSNVLDIGRILHETGWQPVIGWDAGLRHTINWLRQMRAADPHMTSAS